jgi:hypothetical protein
MTKLILPSLFGVVICLIILVAGGVVVMGKPSDDLGGGRERPKIKLLA